MSRLAVVTGASSGIGEATVEELGRRGWRVVLVARSKDRLDATAQQIADAGGEAIVEAVDATDGGAVVAMAGRVQADHGVPDLVVNAAGIGPWKFIEDTPPDEAEACMGAPYQAAYNLTHGFMRGMLDRGSGVVVHVGSPAAFQPWPGSTAYTTARWALRGLNEALNVDLVGTGVRSCHVVFSKISDSAYFDTNEGAAEHLPKISRLLPELTSAACATVIADLADKPRREAIHPRLYRVMAAQAYLMPWFYRWLTAATGAKHPRR